MTRFQVRTPQNFPLESLLRQMALDVWNTTSDLMNPEIVRGLNNTFIFTQLRASLMPYLRRYDLCNLFPECSDEVEGAPWLDRTDKIYLLDLPGGVDSFYDDLAFELLENSRHLFKSGHSREAFTRMRKVFRHSLSRYLYYNPVCGVTQICNESKEIGAWIPEEARAIAR